MTAARRARRAHPGAQRRDRLHRPGGVRSGGRRAAARRAARLAAAPGHAVHAGRMERGQARRGAQALVVALSPRRASPSSRARVDPETLQRAARGHARQRAAVPLRRLEVRGNKRYPEAAGGEPEPDAPGRYYDREVLALYVQRLLQTGYFAERARRARARRRPGRCRAAARYGDRGQHAAGRERRLVQHRRRPAPGALAPQRRPVRHAPGAAQRSCASTANAGGAQRPRHRRRGPAAPGGTTSQRQEHHRCRTRRTPIFARGLSYNWPGAGVALRDPGLGHLRGAALQRHRARPPPRGLFGFRLGFRDTDDLSCRAAAISASHRGRRARRALDAGLRPLHRRAARCSSRSAAATTCCCAPRAASWWRRSREGIPSTFLFRTGGDQTVRGYAFESLGVQRGDAVIGGRYLPSAASRYTHWFSDAWGSPRSSTPAMPGTATTTTRCSASASARASARRSARCASTSPTARKRRPGDCTFPSVSCSKSA